LFVSFMANDYSELNMAMAFARHKIIDNNTMDNKTMDNYIVSKLGSCLT